MLHTSSRRLGAAVAATALSTGALVTLATPAANAGVATNAYNCVNALAGTVPVGVATDVTLPPTAPAGFDVPADLLDVKNKVTIPNQAKALFTQFGVTNLDMTDYKLTLGDGRVGAGSLVVAPTAFVDNGNGTSTADINGKNAAFTTPAADTYVVSAPVDFKLIATLANGSTAEFVCTNAAAPTSVGSVTVQANPATVTGKSKATIKSGKDAKVKVKVTADNEDPTGKVVAMIGTKKVGKGTLADNGKVTITVKAKKLKAGKNKIKLAYAGDGFTAAGKAKVVVKVTK